MAHPGKAGTGLWSSRLEPAGQSSPYSGNDPLRDGRSGRQEADGVRIGALRPLARGQVVRVARFVFMGSIEIRETPV